MMTSLLDSVTYPAADFAALYHSRWRIEEAFKRLKHRLALENTSGLSWLAAQQDFGAKILADNLHALTVLEVGIIKQIMGFRQFSLRGLQATSGEWKLVALAYNLKRMHVWVAG